MATQTRVPTSDLAVSGTWTPFPATPTTRWDKVDDGAGSKDDDTTYIIGIANNDYIVFGFAAFSVPAGAAIAEVRVWAYAKDATSGVNSAKARISVGPTPTDYDHASTVDPDGATYTLYSWAWATNPLRVGNWTPDDVNGVGSYGLKRFGFKVPDAAPDVRFTSAWIECTYEPIIEKSGSDPLSLSVGEAQATLSGLARPDTIGLSLAEAQASLLLADRADDLSISVGEVNALLALLETADSLAATLIELAEVVPEGAVTPIEASDALSLSISEGTVLLLSLLGHSDSLSVSMGEGLELLAALTTADTSTVGLIEAQQSLLDSTLVDILLASLEEAQSSLLNSDRVDPLALSVSEISALLTAIASLDSLNLSVSETWTLLAIAIATIAALPLILSSDSRGADLLTSDARGADLLTSDTRGIAILTGNE